MKVLITGAAGQLGRCILDQFPSTWELFAVNSSELDISQESSVSLMVSSIRPDAIINTAAYTAVDKAEAEPDRAHLINVEGARYLAKAALKCNAQLFHISTDYVFDGKTNHPYEESASTNPLGIYGRTKLDGEQAVISANPQATIIRTSWVFSEYGNNFVKTMLRLGLARNELNIVNDQYGCPTYAGDLAQAILDLINTKKNHAGIYHYCGDTITTWYAFALAIFEQAAQYNAATRKPKLSPITTIQYPTPAKRPAYSALDCHKIQSLGVRLSDWNHRLKHVIPIIMSDRN